MYSCLYCDRHYKTINEPDDDGSDDNECIYILIFIQK